MHEERGLIWREVLLYHCAGGVLLLFCLLSGPPAGESNLHPWDVAFLISALIVFILGPVGWLVYFIRKELSERWISWIATGLVLLLLVGFGAIWLSWKLPNRYKGETLRSGGVSRTSPRV